MSSANAYTPPTEKIEFEGRKRVAIFATSWHQDIVDMMVKDAIEELKNHGIEEVLVHRVPGSFELPQAVSMYLSPSMHLAMKRGFHPKPDGIICFGVLVQGETPHFTFISQAAADNLERIACENAETPILFGVLTTNTVEQALARADGTHSYKGKELALSLLQMMHFKDQLR